MFKYILFFNFLFIEISATYAWVEKIRKDHPRLFFNSETWGDVKKRALNIESDWFEKCKSKIDVYKNNQKNLELVDYGKEAAISAFIYKITGVNWYYKFSIQCIDKSLAYYQECLDEKKAVSWYSISRVHIVMAWDWLYSDMEKEKRNSIMVKLIKIINGTIQLRIHGENFSGYDSGFYGVKNCLWFIALTTYNTGIEKEIVENWLKWSYEENQKLLKLRSNARKDDGGCASPTLAYSLTSYPWAEYNFLYTWQSATGENIASEFSEMSLLSNYIIWNWIEHDPQPFEFGYGDSPHIGNRLPIRWIYTHMANIKNFYGDTDPVSASAANYIQEKLTRCNEYSDSWFIYPFLFKNIVKPIEKIDINRLPNARHFEGMGQVILRSGMSSEDTYCLFSCGGNLKQHRHYDALSFVIYHKGFLAIDSGTRYGEMTREGHLSNYYAQTIAHNSLLIEQPNEPSVQYWGYDVKNNHGGQHNLIGSELIAFEENENYVYVAGDATSCYFHENKDLKEKVSLVTRQLIFINDKDFIIFDRIESTDPSYKKKWLLHTVNKPKIKNNYFYADQGEGRLWCKNLLSANNNLELVGGPNKEFFASGNNWEIDKTGLEPEDMLLMGRWRIEESPKSENKKDYFLHYIQVGDKNLNQMNNIKVTQNKDLFELSLKINDDPWEIKFFKNGDVGGSIEYFYNGTAIYKRLAQEVKKQSGVYTQ